MRESICSVTHSLTLFSLLIALGVTIFTFTEFKWPRSGKRLAVKLTTADVYNGHAFSIASPPFALSLLFFCTLSLFFVTALSLSNSHTFNFAHLLWPLSLLLLLLLSSVLWPPPFGPSLLGCEWIFYWLKPHTTIFHCTWPVYLTAFPFI